MKKLEEAKNFWIPILERQTIFTRSEIEKGLEDFFNQPERLNPEDARDSVCDSLNTTNK